MSSSFVLPFSSRPRLVAVPSRPWRPLGVKVALVVRDLDRAVDFWCGALGFELRLRMGDTWAEVASRGFVVGLSRDAAASAQPWSTATPTITVEVDDLDSALAAVRGHGGGVDELEVAGDRVAGDRLAGGFEQAVRYLSDPDGYRVALCELRIGPTVVPEWYGS